MGLAQASMNPFSLVCKFLTMSTEFDKNFSKWSYCWSQKLHRKDFWTFSVKVIRPSKIKIWWLHFRDKTFFKLKLSKKSFYKSWAPKLIFSNEILFVKNSDNFWHRTMTLKVRILQFGGSDKAHIFWEGHKIFEL